MFNFLRKDPVKQELMERRRLVDEVNRRSESGLPAQRVDLDQYMRPLGGQEDLILPNRMAGERKGLLGKIGGALPVAMNAAFLAPLALSVFPGSQQGSGEEQGDMSMYQPGLSRSEQAMREQMIREAQVRQLMGG